MECAVFLAPVVALNFILNEKLVILSRHSECPGTTFNYFPLSCLAISRYMVFSPFTLCWWELRTPQHFMALLSKTLPKMCSRWKHIVNSRLWPNKTDLHRSISCSFSVNSVSFLTPTVLQKSGLLHAIFNSLPKSHVSAISSWSNSKIFLKKIWKDEKILYYVMIKACKQD